jgi:hypothetical protein
VRLVVLRRCVLESRLDPEECAARLRRSTHRLEPPLLVWRPFVGRVSAEGFSVRSARRRALPVRANGTFALGRGEGAEIRLDLGVAILELIPLSVLTVYFVVGLLGVNADLGGLMFAILAVVWLGMLAFPVRRWSRRADELIARLCATCEAEPAQLADAFS